MAELYRTAPLETTERAATVVVHCSDPRYQPHFHDFLRQHLKLDHYALVAVPGGSQFLTLAEYLPKFSWVGWRWFKFLVGITRPERFILIAHDDCLWYKDGRFWSPAGDLRQQQVRDLAGVRAELAERFPAARVELYYARLHDGRAAFEAL